MTSNQTTAKLPTMARAVEIIGSRIDAAVNAEKSLKKESA